MDETRQDKILNERSDSAQSEKIVEESKDVSSVLDESNPQNVQNEENESGIRVDDFFNIIPGADEKEPYLILIVHGIGSITQTQEINKRHLDEAIEAIIGNGYQTELEYQFVTHMIDWKSVVDSSDVRNRLLQTSIRGDVQDARSMFNLTAPDILQYLSPSFKNQIQQTVVNKANDAYRQMHLVNHNFKGKVSVVAHSLGTVIAYDLFTQQGSAEEDLQFVFQTENVFLLGSPIGMFVSVYQAKTHMPSSLPTVKNFYNIFHPSDLIACRVEPLINDWHPLAPVLVPCYWNGGLNKAYQIFHYMTDKVQNIMTKGEETSRDAPRYDFILQERGIEPFVKAIGLLNAHTGYFQNKDVANFILLKIHNKKMEYSF